MPSALRPGRPSPATVRRAFLGALVMNAAIVVTGAAVRLTASGLGCPTFPRCTDDSLVATRELGLHGVIEFGNRLLTFAVTAAVLTAVFVAWRAGRRDLLRPAVVLLAGILAQALLGGVTVLTGLHPVTVMAHFLLSMVLIAVAVVAHHRAGGAGGRDTGDTGDTDDTDDSRGTEPVHGAIRLGVLLLSAAVALVLVLGTVVTGTGPHSGDKDAADRLPFDLATVTQVHADLVFVVVGLTVGLLVAVRASGAPDRLSRRAWQLLAVVLAQGILGLVQYVTDLPVLLVGIHVLGACLVWIATVRVLVATRDGSERQQRVHSDRHEQQGQVGDRSVEEPHGRSLDRLP